MNKMETVAQIRELTAQKANLTDWEQSFIDSITKQMSTRALSDKQVETVERIHKKNAHSEEWVAEFRKKYLEDLKVLAKYYAKAKGGTFYKGIQKLNENPDFIPTEETVLKALQNQYAKRVLRAHKSSWRFKPADIACIRRTINPNSIRGKDGFRVYGYFKEKIVEQVVMITERHDKEPDQWHVYSCAFLSDPTKELLIQERFLKSVEKKTKR
tara:strand:- start:1964 stop:2602 length:639 start_codon:yes stop_codon:yes gene_type:complete